MDSASKENARPRLEVRGARASSVIVQKIPPGGAEDFMAWQRGITDAAAESPGYQSTEIYPPSAQQDEWVVIIHFDDPTTLQSWLDSPKRAEWLAKFPCESRDFRLKMLPTGFGAWFAGLDESGKRLPHWKSALTVLLGLYPTVMMLQLFLAPHTQHFGLAIAILIGNVVSVIFLEWLGMPVISRVLGPWLRANTKELRVQSVAGLFVILGTLALMAFLFHLATHQP